MRIKSDGVKIGTFTLTEPKFSSEIPKSIYVVIPVTVKVLTAILTSLKHLQLHQNFRHHHHHHHHRHHYHCH